MSHVPAVQPAAPQPNMQERERHALSNMPLSAWLRIASNGIVTVFTGKVEVGQGIRTSLAQLVAEELRLPVASIEMVMGDTGRTPFDMGTFGSRTTPTTGAHLRRVAATAREHLLDVAAQRWHVSRGEVQAVDGRVIHPASGRAATYAELASDQAFNTRVLDQAPVTPPEQWTTAGGPAPRTDALAAVTGHVRFTSDLKLQGMGIGILLRPPAFAATLRSLDARAAAAVPGVTVVHEGSFVGVVAPDEQTARRAVAVLRAEWDVPMQPAREEVFDYLRSHPAVTTTNGWGGTARFEQGDVAAGTASADHRLYSTYTVAYLQHVPLETRAALARWDADNLTVWTGTQRPFGVREQLADAFGLAEEQVRVIVPETGSGFGGKHFGDAALEAARLARVVGRPVKVVWTREEEVTGAVFRPAAGIDVASAARSDGSLLSWEFHNYNAGANAIRPPYVIPNQIVEFHPAETLLRQGSYRALAATANHFARETHLDELAHALSVDPLQLRLRNCHDSRLAAVLEAAAERFGWGQTPSAAHHGVGSAGGTEKGSYVATCAEVAVDWPSGQVQITRVVQAFECGAIVNPDNLRNQVEGAIIQGIGGALFEAVDAHLGKIVNPRFSRYRVPRFGDIPTIEVVLLDRKDLPSAGAGETPIVGIAPAAGNAIFNATGIRLRTMPLVPRGLAPFGEAAR